MLKEIRNQLITDIGTQFPTWSRVLKYKGEFEEGSDWNPTPNAVFLQVLGNSIKVMSAHSEILKKAAVIKVYAGSNSLSAADPLDIVEPLMDFLDGATLAVSAKKYTIKVDGEGIDYIYYDRGFEAYSFIIQVF